ncbi:multicopper oxidase domain-containing protein [Streptosporangium sp. NPDC051022]|uniref:multicopper oxidase domain-containing protein n=1 Tax=Streptosporangium sp. NPDC051022 TaxID=3155752 RepID=UPI0034369203
MRRTLVLVLIAACLVLPGRSAAAAGVTIDLCVSAGTLSLPGSASAAVWGFSQAGPGGSCAGATPSLPGPVLSVHEGDEVSLVVHNTLTTPVSLEIPGVPLDQGAGVTAAAGAAATATFTASAPGTYLYQGTERQLPMGLYGALVVRPATAGRAYASAATAYDREAVLVLSAIDPAFNASPATADLHRYAPKYWLINGKAYPDTDPVHGGPPGTTVLLRYLNAGFDNTSMRLLGLYERVIARDAHPLGNPFEATSETIPAGGTEDAVVTVPPTGSRFALYNRQLHLTNGASSPGGMLTFVEVP